MQKRVPSNDKPHCLDRYRLASEAADFSLMERATGCNTHEGLATLAVALQLQALRLLLEERLK